MMERGESRVQMYVERIQNFAKLLEEEPCKLYAFHIGELASSLLFELSRDDSE